LITLVLGVQSWTLKVFRLIIAELQPKYGVSGPARAAAKPPGLCGWAARTCRKGRAGGVARTLRSAPGPKASACCGFVALGEAFVALGIYRTRAAAGIGSACGLGASPTPDLRESARAAPTHTQAIPPGCTPRLQWGSVVAWSSTAATTGFVRGHRAPQSRPTTDGSTETPTTDAHVCANGPFSHLLPGALHRRPASSKLQLRT
jgi:hypothetical protein